MKHEISDHWEKHKKERKDQVNNTKSFSKENVLILKIEEKNFQVVFQETTALVKKDE